MFGIADPSFRPYLQACAVGVMLSMLASFTLGRAGFGSAVAHGICIALLICLCAKALQAALSYFSGRHYPLHTVIWYLLASQLLGGLLAFAVSGVVAVLVQSATGLGAEWAPAGEVHRILAIVLAYPASVYLAASLFSGTRSYQSAVASAQS